MLIAVLDHDRQFTKRLNKLLKSLMTDIDYVVFYSPSDCLDFAKKHNLSLIFINQSIGGSFADLQILHYKLRKICPHVDIFIVYDENEQDNTVALWTIKSRCSDYISKSVQKERLHNALQNTWFNPILKSS